MDNRLQDDKSGIRHYRHLTRELFTGIIPDGAIFEYGQNLKGLGITDKMKDEVKSGYMLQRRQAWNKLARLSNLRPPTSVIHIHALYLEAIIRVIDGWRALINGNLFKASKTFEISTNLFKRTEELWNEVDFE